MKTVEVVAAIIIKDNKILCTQRLKDDPYLSLKWEFPGGKIEKGETHIEALKREIQEELELNIDVQDYLMTVNHSYDSFHIIMHTYKCSINEAKISLNEHHQFKWLVPNKLSSLDWADADLDIVKNIVI